jgi:hypothetical protein
MKDNKMINELNKQQILEKIREIKIIIENSNIELNKESIIIDSMMIILSNCEITH